MDYYLEENTSLMRLKEEFQKYGKLILAVDFDDTILGYNSGSINSKIATLLKRWKPYAEIIIWSCRREDEYDFILRTCVEAGFVPDKINEPSDLVDFGTRKIYANAILDDRAGLKQVYNDLNIIIDWIERGDIKYNEN